MPRDLAREPLDGAARGESHHPELAREGLDDIQGLPPDGPGRAQHGKAFHWNRELYRSLLNSAAIASLQAASMGQTRAGTKRTATRETTPSNAGIAGLGRPGGSCQTETAKAAATEAIAGATESQEGSPAARPRFGATAPRDRNQAETWAIGQAMEFG